MDIRSSTGVSAGESMEEQRKWSDKKWDQKEKDPTGRNILIIQVLKVAEVMKGT